MKKGALVLVLMCLLSLGIVLSTKEVKANWDDSFITNDNYHFTYYYEFELTTTNADYYQLTYLLNEFVIKSTPPNDFNNVGNGWDTYRIVPLGCYFFIDELDEYEEPQPYLKDYVIIYSTGTYPNISYSIEFGGDQQESTYLSVNYNGINDYQFWGNLYLSEYLLTTPLFNSLYETGFLTRQLPQYYIDITDYTDYKMSLYDTIVGQRIAPTITQFETAVADLLERNRILQGQVDVVPETFFTNIFNSFKDVLDTPILPPFTIGTFILIPLMFALLGVIIHLLRG